MIRVVGDDYAGDVLDTADVEGGICWAAAEKHTVEVLECSSWFRIKSLRVVHADKEGGGVKVFLKADVAAQLSTDGVDLDGFESQVLSGGVRKDRIGKHRSFKGRFVLVFRALIAKSNGPTGRRSVVIIIFLIVLPTHASP